MDPILLAVILGIGFGLFVGLGAGINHGLERRAYRKRVCSIVTAEDHREEAARLIHEAIHSHNSGVERYLRNQAFAHFVIADQIENGPYKY